MSLFIFTLLCYICIFHFLAYYKLTYILLIFKYIHKDIYRFMPSYDKYHITHHALNVKISDDVTGIL